MKKIAFINMAALAVVSACAAAAVCMPAADSGSVALADDSAYCLAEESAVQAEEEVSSASPRLFTSLSLTIGGGDGRVYATAKNDFTLFPSTVAVTVSLYSSETYTTDYTQMELEAVTSTADLDMGVTITAEASTDGKTKYWIARMTYKIDNADWQSKDTGVTRYDGNGTFLS